MKGEPHNVYYIPGVPHRLIRLETSSPRVGNPQLSRNGFTRFNTNELLITHTVMKSGVYPLTLQNDLPRFWSSCR